MDARDLVLDYLGTLQMQGAARLPVDESARLILREWMLAARNGAPRVVAPARTAQPAPQQPAPVPAAQQADRPAPPAADSPGAEAAQYLAGLRRSLDDATPADSAGEEEDIPFFRPGGSTEEEAWGNLHRLLPAWKPLRELNSLREKPVYGEGNRHAAIMMVGDAPNYYDEKAGHLFQNEVGNKLDGMLKAMGLTRADIYLTPLVKFRPEQPRQTMNTRPPTEREIRFSMPVLDLEVALVRPRVIVALGVIAARGLLQRGNIPLSEYQQMPGDYRGIPVVVTHHPSYLIRTSDLAERRRLWEEMLRVMEMVGLPISDKQRGYFLPKQG